MIHPLYRPTAPSIEQRRQLEAALAPALGVGVQVLELFQLPSQGLGGWVIGTDRGHVLMKVNRHPSVAHAFANAWQAHRLARRHGIPVPVLHGVGPLPNPLGAEFFLLAWTHGLDGHLVYEQLTADGIHRLGHDFGQLVARLHAIDAPHFSPRTVGGPVIADWRQACLDEVTGFYQLRLLVPPAWQTRLDAVIQSCGRLAEGLSGDIRPALTHGDLNLGNLIVHEGRLQAVTDFENAGFLDPIVDFVKLRRTVTERYPEVHEAFLVGYRSLRPWEPDADRRLQLYLGIDLLRAIRTLAGGQGSSSDQPHLEAGLDAWLGDHQALA